MLTLLLAAILAGASHAATPCCMDRQFEAVFGEIGGAVYATSGHPTEALINGQNIMHYDYYTRKIAIESTLFFQNGTNATSDVLIDYQKDIMYIKTGGNCFQMPNQLRSSFLEPCIPSNAVHVRSSYIGYGVHQIPFTTWQFFEPKTGTVLRLSVTDVGCVPFVEASFGTTFQGNTDLVFIITGFKPGLKKTNLLKVPDNCPPVPTGALPNTHKRAMDSASKLLNQF